MIVFRDEQEVFEQHPGIRYLYQNQSGWKNKQGLTAWIESHTGDIKYSVTHTYKPPRTCKLCGGEDLMFKTIFTAPHTYQLRIRCNHCKRDDEAVKALENM